MKWMLFVKLKILSFQYIFQMIKRRPYNDKMKTFQFLVCLSILIYLSSQVVILQSTTVTSVTSPVGAATLISTSYNSLRKNAAGTGVQWITSTKIGSPTRYQSLFYASCIGKANLTITAASNFSVYLDGVFIGSGNNQSKIYRFPINIKCGSHNFTVIVYTAARVNQGLTFALNQDQSNCYSCQATGYWNEYSCSCACITSSCGCTSPKIWKPYPVCGCGCPPLPITLRILPFCLYPKYYNQQSCGCRCHYRYCPPGQYFNDVTCQCYTIIK